MMLILFSYLFEKDKLIKHAQLTVLRWPLGILKNKNLNEQTLNVPIIFLN